MFSEWVTQGVGWGVRIFFAAFTIFAIVGVFVGVCALVVAFTSGGDDEKNNKDEFNRPRHA